MGGGALATAMEGGCGGRLRVILMDGPPLEVEGAPFTFLRIKDDLISSNVNGRIARSTFLFLSKMVLSAIRDT